LFSGTPEAKYDEDIGWHARSIVGFRNDDELRKASASGGLTTWCLESLFTKGAITRAGVVRFANTHDNGFFEFHAASTIDELRRSSGSVYHPVEISQLLAEVLSNRDGRWAIVGVPCLCAALRNSPRLAQRVPYVFGLACGMYQNTFYTELLLSKSGVSRESITGVEYRRKSDGVPASDYRLRGTDNRGHGKEVPYHGLPYYLGKHAFFRLNACNFCMDVFAETADACFMDAWLPEYRQEPKGTSLVVIRNRELSELFEQGQHNGEISIEPICSEKVVASQRGHVRRKRELIYMRRGIQAPTDKPGVPQPTAREKVHWLLQRHAQKRSKKAWANYGRRYGRFAFWLALADLVLMQIIAGLSFSMLRLPKRLIAMRRNASSQIT